MIVGYDKLARTVRSLLGRNRKVVLEAAGDEVSVVTKGTRQTLTDEQRRQCAELYRSGKNLREIAEIVDCSTFAVRASLRSQNVPLRRRGHPGINNAGER